MGALLQEGCLAQVLDAYLVMVHKHDHGPVSGSERYGWELEDIFGSKLEARDWQTLQGQPAGLAAQTIDAEDIMQVWAQLLHVEI